RPVAPAGSRHVPARGRDDERVVDDVGRNSRGETAAREVQTSEDAAREHVDDSHPPTHAGVCKCECEARHAKRAGPAERRNERAEEKATPRDLLDTRPTREERAADADQTGDPGPGRRG